MNIPASGLQGPTFATNSHSQKEQPVQRLAYVTYIENAPRMEKQQKRLLQMLGLSFTVFTGFIFSESAQKAFSKVAPAVAKKVNIPIVLMASGLALFYGSLIQAARLSRINSQTFTLQNPNLNALKQAGDLVQLRTNGKVQSIQQGEPKGLDFQ